MLGLKAESDELLALDLLRFVAAVGVVFYHYGSIWLASSGHLELAHRFGFLNLFVDLFFVISGFVITWVYADRIRTRRDYGKFLWRRVARLVPLHWATLAFYILAFAAMTAVGVRTANPAVFAWADLPQVALFLHAFGGVRGPAFNFPAWSISSEMVMYALFPLLLMLGRRGWPLALVVVGAFGWLALTDVGVIGGANPWENRTFDFGVIRALSGFAFGMGLYLLPTPKLAPGVALAGALALLAVYVAIGPFVTVGSALVPLIYGCVTLAVWSDRSGVRPGWLKVVAPLGALTYSIYMLHMPVKTGVSYAAAILGMQADRSLAWLGLTVVVLAVASWMSYFWLEQPARRWLGRMVR